jgi:hypothetical protein
MLRRSGEESTSAFGKKTNEEPVTLSRHMAYQFSTPVQTIGAIYESSFV